MDRVVIPNDISKARETHLIVATLAATETLAAGFTVHGGFNDNDGPHQGMANLTRVTTFKAFLITDTIAMSLSIFIVFLHFYSSFTRYIEQLDIPTLATVVLTSWAMSAMLLGFVTGTYAMLEHSSSHAISVCVVTFLPFFIFQIYFLIKQYKLILAFYR
ncbi:hypothetical protein LOK49_LG06G02029 [Camellia lanceoleosa]|uniref:Uncharacterized protein n=1 Tax=Camellia lanceoleosa TaxID=1840588 RepID=A0ACC0HF02_9ERIC|nr:hypothetical protein LOK49_LG06G02029 [Camellia lanceoleosa]